ncbi:MAG: hypothetical protein OXH00_13990 [Candidatus Poribacteria bacterium]|nr:hypothetical protein [Candidatus Poribacteria bacterium]
MNSKNLKVIAAVILSCLIMIVIVISTPKPEPRRSKRRLPSKKVDPKYLRLANQALAKANKANEAMLQKLGQLANGEKADFNPLTATNIAAIDALAEADKSIKLCNEELQDLNKEEVSPTILIQANMKLIASLNAISEIVKALNTEVQHLEKENTQPLPPAIEKIVDASRKLINATEKGTKALDETISAYREYHQLDQL